MTTVLRASPPQASSAAIGHRPAMRLTARLTDGTPLVLAVAVPLLFNPFGVVGFEPFKMTLIRLGALALLICTCSTWGDDRSRLLWANRQARLIWLACAALLATMALTTAVSIHPLQSLLGSYDRLGGLLSSCALVVVAWSVAHRTSRPARLVDWLLLGSVPVCLYALAQHYRLDPFPWLGRTPGPASTIGSSTALGGYAAMLAPLAIWRALSFSRPRPLVMALLGLLCWVVGISGVRGALLGLLAGLATWWLLSNRLHNRQASWWIAGPLVGLPLLALAFGLSAQPSRWIDPEPSIAAPAEREGFDTARERLLIWRSSLEALAAGGPRLLLGYGPETQPLALEATFPVELANRLPDQRYDRVHNELLDHAVTSGLLGALAFLTLASTAVRAGFGLARSPRDRALGAALTASLVAHLVESTFAFGSAATLLLFWMVIGLIANRLTFRDAGSESAAATLPATRIRVRQATAVALALVLGPILMSPILADLAYTRGLAYAAGEDPVGWTVWTRRATRLAPDRDLYIVALADSLGQRAAGEPRDRVRQELLSDSELAARRAVALNQADPYTWFTLAEILTLRSEAERSTHHLEQAMDAYERAARLSPHRALLLDAAGLALQRLGRHDEALDRFQRAARVAGADAEHLARAGISQLALGEPLQAEQSFQQALLLGPNTAAAHGGLAQLYSQRGEVDAAIDAARRASRLRLRDWRLRVQLAVLLEGVGRYGEALTEARAAARYAPPWEREWLRGEVVRLRPLAARTEPGSASATSRDAS